MGSWAEPEVKKDSQSGPQATHCSSADLQPARWRGAGWLSHSVCGFLLFLPLLPPSFVICVFTPVFLAGRIPGLQLTVQTQTADCFRPASTSSGLRNHCGKCGLKTGLRQGGGAVKSAEAPWVSPLSLSRMLLDSLSCWCEKLPHWWISLMDLSCRSQRWIPPVDFSGRYYFKISLVDPTGGSQ